MRREQHTVERDSFPGTHLQHVTRTDSVRCDLLCRLSITHDPRRLRTDIKQRTDMSACPAHSALLQLLTHGVEKHDGHAFRIFADVKRSDRSQRHQSKLVEKLSLAEAFPSLPEHRNAHRQKGHKEVNHLYPGTLKCSDILGPQDDSANQQHEGNKFSYISFHDK